MQKNKCGCVMMVALVVVVASVEVEHRLGVKTVDFPISG